MPLSESKKCQTPTPQFIVIHEHFSRILIKWRQPTSKQFIFPAYISVSAAQSSTQFKFLGSTVLIILYDHTLIVSNEDPLRLSRCNHIVSGWVADWSVHHSPTINVWDCTDGTVGSEGGPEGLQCLWFVFDWTCSLSFQSSYWRDFNWMFIWNPQTALRHCCYQGLWRLRGRHLWINCL